MKENFPNLVKKIDMQVQGAQKIPKFRDKEGLLKAAREKLVTTCLADGRGEGENGWRGEGIKKYK